MRSNLTAELVTTINRHGHLEDDLVIHHLDRDSAHAPSCAVLFTTINCRTSATARDEVRAA